MLERTETPAGVLQKTQENKKKEGKEEEGEGEGGRDKDSPSHPAQLGHRDPYSRKHVCTTSNGLRALLALPDPSDGALDAVSSAETACVLWKGSRE
jgi:hypothetical protein